MTFFLIILITNLVWLLVSQMWIEFGRIQLPPGHHPNDMEKEWGKLIVAMLEREKSLRPELERYEKTVRAIAFPFFFYTSRFIESLVLKF